MKRVLLFFVFLFSYGITYSQNVVILMNPDSNHHCSYNNYVNPEREIIEYNNKLYFPVTDTVHGYELWISDGTSEGTHIFKDYFVDIKETGIWPRYLTNYNGYLYFLGTNDIANNCIASLYRTDGDSSNLLPAIRMNNTCQVRDLKVQKGKLSFVVNDTSFYEYDGSQELLIPPFRQEFLFEYNNKEYYHQNDTLYSINSGDSIRIPLCECKRFLQYDTLNGFFYFSKFDSLYGDEMWLTDGTVIGTRLLTNINKHRTWTGEDLSSMPYYYILSNPYVKNYYYSTSSKMYFLAKDTFAFYLYETDGTAANTKRCSDIPFNYSAVPNPVYCTFGDEWYLFNNKVYLSSNPITYIDLLLDTLVVTNLFSGGNGMLYSQFNDKLYIFSDSVYEMDTLGNIKTLPNSRVSKLRTNKRIIFNDELYFFVSTIHGESLAKITFKNVGINNINPYKFAIYPNPVASTLHLTIENEGRYEIDFYNLMGQKIYTRNVANKAEIDVSAWERGLYFYQLFENGRQVGNGKVVRE